MQTLKTSLKYSREERETHLWYDPERKLWTMESNISKHFNRAVKQGWNVEKKFVDDDGIVSSMLLTAPERGIGIRSPEKRQVNMSDEQKEAVRERFKNYRIKNKK